MSPHLQPGKKKLIFGALTVLGYLGLVMLSWMMPDKTLPEWAAAWGLTRPPTPLPQAISYGLLLFILGLLWISYYALVYRANEIEQKQMLLLLVVPVLATIVSVPALSHDTTLYLAYGRLLAAQGVNPYTHAPQGFSQDPIVALTDWPTLPAPYGPVWVSVVGLIAWISRNQVVLAVSLIRLLSLGAHLLSAWLISRLAQRWRNVNANWILGLVVFNPLLLIESAFNGHSDAPTMALLLLALYLDARGSRLWAWASLAASVLVKYVTLPAAALYALYVLRRDGLRSWLSGILIFILISGALFAPYWAGLDTFQGLRAETTRFDTASVPQAIHTALLHILPRMAPQATPLADLSTQILTLAPVVAISVILLARQRAQPLQLVRQSTLLLIVWITIGNNHLRQWYFVWPLSLGLILTPHPVTTLALALGIGASAYYVSPAFADAPLLKALFVLVCFGWPGWLLLRTMLREWKRELA